MRNRTEKPVSNRAKTHFNHTKKQDHGDAAVAKGHEDFGFFETKWNMRASESERKNSLYRDIDAGLDEYYAGMDSGQLEQEADRILREAEGDETVVDTDEDTLVEYTQPTIGELGGWTKKEIRDRLARIATEQDYSEDDFGYDSKDASIRTSTKPR